MSFCLPCGLTAQQVIEGLGELAQAGLTVLGQAELAALVPIIEKLAEDGAALIAQGPTAEQVLRTEVDAEQGAADALEDAKFPRKEPPTKP